MSASKTDETPRLAAQVVTAMRSAGGRLVVLHPAAPARPA
jgi:hypothetical protein